MDHYVILMVWAGQCEWVYVYVVLTLFPLKHLLFDTASGSVSEHSTDYVLISLYVSAYEHFIISGILPERILIGPIIMFMPQVIILDLPTAASWVLILHVSLLDLDFRKECGKIITINTAI
jgi:hypothetical protein